MATIRVSELIRQAYILAQVWDPNEEQPGDEASLGLFYLNLLINQWSSLSTFIPAYNTVTLALNQGVYKFTQTPVITDILEAHITDSANTQFNLREANLQQFNLWNFNNQPGRPGAYFVESDFDDIQNTTNLYVYPVADQNYTLTLYVKKVLPEFAYSDVITNLPNDYFKPLLYQLAKDLSTAYLTTLSPEFKEEYTKIISDLKSTNRKDLSVVSNNPYATWRRFLPWNIYVG